MQFRVRLRFSVAELRAELPEMMIQMLVHQDRPFVRSKRPEKCVRMRGASRSPRRGEAIDQAAQALSIRFKVSLIADDQELL